MALKKININEHSMLLYRLSNLPYDDERAKELEKALKGNYEQYQELLFRLEEVITAYEATALKIKARHFLKKSDEKTLMISA